MGIEVRPYGARCNIQCQYCYQNPERDIDGGHRPYDLNAIKESLNQLNKPFGLFGGEALLMPVDDLENLWAWGLNRFGSNQVQTNGTLINQRHIELFHKYKVGVGISLDGPEDLNDARWAGSSGTTREATRKIHDNIRWLLDEGIRPSLIITLHRGNATKEKLPRMYEWVREFDRLGIRSARLHMLEVEDARIAQTYELTPEENLTALLGFLRLEQQLDRLSFDIFGEMRRMLLGDDKDSTCIWNACDPYTTRAVQGVEGDGASSNCGRTNKLGINFLKADAEGFERYLSLYHTPQQHDGCQGCRFFLFCKGQCPGTATHGDWRNRTANCSVWMALFDHLEKQIVQEGKTPLSLDPIRPEVEAEMLSSWAAGEFLYIRHALERARAKNSRKMATNEDIVSPIPAPAVLPSNPTNDVGETPGPFGMHLLPFRLPDFTRLSWVSDEVRSLWLPRLQKIQQMWSELDWMAVEKGAQRCAVLMLSPGDLIRKGGELASKGLNVLPLQVEGLHPPGPNAPIPEPRFGDSIFYRVVVGNLDDTVEFKRSLDSGADRRIGDLLGSPACCRDSFREIWVKHGLTDPVWPFATLAAGGGGTSREVTVSIPPQTNPLFRSIGVRLVSHVPCSADCQKTLKIAQAYESIARANGFSEVLDWALEMLSWPVLWTSLHGISEVRSPVFKIMASTDATAHRLSVRKLGTNFPEGGAKGLEFPYQVPNQLQYTRSAGFERGLAHQLVTLI